jgi:hypothetical protein
VARGAGRDPDGDPPLTAGGSREPSEGEAGTDGGRTRRSFLVSGALTAFGVAAGGLARPLADAAATPLVAADDRVPRAVTAQLAVPDPPLKDGDYWAFADWLQPAMDRLWTESDSVYTHDSRINASALMTHAVAALEGHEGDCRRDERARKLAARLCESPPFKPGRRGHPTRHTDPRSESQGHAPGFVSTVNRLDSAQHITVDPKVARALYYAWRARDELELPEALVRRIVETVRAVAYSPFFRYPNIRLNQINFAAELQACAASMTGDSTLLRRDYRRQLARFLDGAKRSVRPWRIANLGPSYSFHRNPFERSGARENIESAEYANIVLDVIYYYEQARRGGMKPLSRGQARTLRAWVRRALPAYWTHSGYLNWDTGLYLYRWHLSRYWAWSVQGLLAIATSRNFVHANERRWAKHMFDRSLALYERYCERWDDDRREPGSSLYGITTAFSEGRHFELARFQALSAEAVLRGLGGKSSEEPPPLYAFDPTIGRLAVTTPSYNTAMVGVSNGAFPYGGIELARLYDSSQRVVSHIGGRAPAGIGLVVRGPSGRMLAASQRPRAVLKPGRRPVSLSRSPQGPIRRGARYPRSPYAGRFETLVANGFVERAGVRFESRYQFRTDHIDIAWRLTRRRTDPISAEALFPTWGGESTVHAKLKNGQTVRLRRNLPGLTQVQLTELRYFFVDGSETGYVVIPRTVPAGAVARLIQPKPQGSNPRPGPSIQVGLARVGHWGVLTFAVTIAVARTAADAEGLVARIAPGR